MSGHRLQLEVIGAAGLVYNKRFLRRQDPYVTVEVGGQTYKSKVAKNTGTDPTWNEEFTTDVPANSGPARITVYDKNVMAQDDVLGVATYDFNSASGQQETIRLQSPEGEANGEVFIRAQYAGAHGGAGSRTAHSGVAATGGTMGSVGTGMGAGAVGAGMGAGAMGAGMGHHGHGHGETVTAGNTRGATMGQGTTTGTDYVVQPVGTGNTHSRGAVGEFVQGEAPSNVCHTEYFTKIEDRPVIKERVERIREHIPVEREMVTEIRTTGREQELPDRTAESLGIQERLVEVTPPAKCP